MFKHILLPIDGSELSEAAIQKGIQFAPRNLKAFPVPVEELVDFLTGHNIEILKSRSLMTEERSWPSRSLFKEKLNRARKKSLTRL